MLTLFDASLWHCTMRSSLQSGAICLKTQPPIVLSNVKGGHWPFHRHWLQGLWWPRGKSHKTSEEYILDIFLFHPPALKMTRWVFSCLDLSWHGAKNSELMFPAWTHQVALWQYFAHTHTLQISNSHVFTPGMFIINMPTSNPCKGEGEVASKVRLGWDAYVASEQCSERSEHVLNIPNIRASEQRLNMFRAKQCFLKYGMSWLLTFFV